MGKSRTTLQALYILIMMVCIFFTTGFTSPNTVELYFSDFQNLHLIIEERKVEACPNFLAETVVQELIKGPKEPYLYPTVPGSIEVNSVYVDDAGTCYVDFKEQPSLIGSMAEVLFVDSFVYSLTELEGIEKVQFLLNGEKNFSPGEHTGVLKEPLKRGSIKTHTIFIDEERARWLQEKVLQNEDLWRLTPLEVAKREGKAFGFKSDDEFKLLKKYDSLETPVCFVTAVHEKETYIITLEKPLKSSKNSIWMISNIDKVK